MTTSPSCEGILLVNKEIKKTSFSIVYMLRKRTLVQKIGHTGTLDPFAQGVMVMLIGKKYTRLCTQLINEDKEYEARLFLGASTTTFDVEGERVSSSDKIPSLKEIEAVLSSYQGKISQMPPMFSAKKIGGQKLYHLARKGIEVPRESVEITVKTTLVSYNYPFLDLHFSCSKGTYIRSLGHDIGKDLGCGAYLYTLNRTRTGQFQLQDCIEQSSILDPNFHLESHIKHL